MCEMIQWLNQNAGAASTLATLAVSAATVIYVILTYKLVQETRKARIGQLQPRLIVDIELINGHFFHLIVRNTGYDLAQNIIVVCEPALTKFSNLTLGSLSPTQDYRQYLLMSDPECFKETVITLSAVYENSAGKRFESIRKIDMSVYNVDAFNPKKYKEITDEIKSMNRDITSSLKDIAKACSKR